MIAKGRFRQDLYYRLQTLELEIPPLRERPEDLEALIALFVGRALAQDVPVASIFSEEILEVFARYPWPGNVRELEAMTRRMALLARHHGQATLDMLPEKLAEWYRGRPASMAGLSLREHLDRAERERIGHALIVKSGNRSKAAKALGISRNQLYRRMEKLGIRVPK